MHCGNDVCNCNDPTPSASIVSEKILLDAPQTLYEYLAKEFSTNDTEYEMLLKMHKKFEDIESTQLVQNIICEVDGTHDFKAIMKYLDEGTTSFIYDLRYDTFENHSKMLNLIRSAMKKFNEINCTTLEFGIILTINGRETKLGRLAHDKNIDLKANKTFILTGDRRIANNGTKVAVYVNCLDYLTLVRPSDKIIINNLVELIVLQIINNSIECQILTSGTINSFDPVKFPSDCQFDKLTMEEDLDVKFAMDNNIKILMVPNPLNKIYVKSMKNSFLKYNDNKIMLLTKISIEHIPEKQITKSITELYSGVVMISDDKLGSSITTEQRIVATKAEKQLIDLCFQKFKPIILLPQLIEKNSKLMDIRDKDNKYLYYYPDSYFISKYTSVDLQTIFEPYNSRTLDIITTEYGTINADKSLSGINTFFKNITVIASVLKASAIILFTKTGISAKKMSHYRPACPIIAVTDNELIAVKLLLYSNLKVVLVPNSLREIRGFTTKRNKTLLYGLFIGMQLNIIKEMADASIVFCYKSTPGLNYSDTFTIVEVSMNELENFLINNQLKPN